MRALVTGGAGFIGSNLVDALLDEDHEVAVIDNLSTGRIGNLALARERGAVLHEVDILDAEAVADIAADLRPDAIFHLAAQIDVRRSVSEPAFDARVNVEGTINMLEAARRSEAARFVFVSTGGAIYGDAAVIPTPEETYPKPMSGYGQSKFCAECYCGLYARLYGLPAVTLRLGNVYGPRQDPLGEAGVVAIFCGKLLDGATARVNGDGNQTRDYIFVGDVVQALLAAQKRHVSGEINIGTGIETSVLEVLAGLRALAGPQGLPAEHGPALLGELTRSCLDVRRARQLLEWHANTSLYDGLSLTLAATRADIAAGRDERKSGDS